MAFCNSRNIRMINLPFKDYAQYFNISDNKFLISYPPSNFRISSRFVRKTLQETLRKSALFAQYAMPRFPGIAALAFDEYSANPVKKLDSQLNHPLVFVRGWYFRDYQNFYKYADEIRDYFRPKQNYILAAEQFCDKIRQTADMLVGLHIRRGDYRRWNSGKYYFEDAVYIQVMRSIIDQFPHKKIRFLIASDEPIILENYRRVIDNIVWERRIHIVDLMVLAHCDYIVGPPSTFSMWSSFYGKVPLLTIEKPGETIDLTKAYVRQYGTTTGIKEPFDPSGNLA
jgi:hypothetical protein